MMWSRQRLRARSALLSEGWAELAEGVTEDIYVEAHTSAQSRKAEIKPLGDKRVTAAERTAAAESSPARKNFYL
jgi:hypothetical protein